ncbi:hypothetical protein BGW42_000316, partial [Actinomortierella wolfii]
MAADQGCADAQYGLGDMYDFGLGTEQDDTQSFSWFMKSAEQGCSNAQFSAGLLYELGIGTEQNDSEARTLYEKAMEQEYPNAERHLKLLNDPERPIPKDGFIDFSWYLERAQGGDAAA